MLNYIFLIPVILSLLNLIHCINKSSIKAYTSIISLENFIFFLSIYIVILMNYKTLTLLITIILVYSFISFLTNRLLKDL